MDGLGWAASLLPDVDPVPRKRGEGSRDGTLRYHEPLPGQGSGRGPQLFLLSLKAGGVGLNLTRASHVFHIDRWWNPAVENQATDRAYRIGQTNRVMVHKFITSGSVEEKIDRMIREKSRLAEDIIGSGEDWLGGLEMGQLKELVSLEDTST